MKIIFENEQSRFDKELIDTILDLCQKVCEKVVENDITPNILSQHDDDIYVDLSFVDQEAIRELNK